MSANVLDPDLDAIIGNPPDDTISSIKFSPTSNLLAVTSWDNSIRCYRYYDDSLDTKHIGTKHHNRGVLCCCWNGTGSKVLSGGCDNKINIWDIGKMCKTNYYLLGYPKKQHKAAVKCLEYSKKYNVVLSGSWDKTVKLWDLRCNNNTNTCFGLPLNTKVYAMSCKGNNFIVGAANGYIYHCDFRNLSKFKFAFARQLWYEKKTSGTTVLRKQLRDLDMFPNEKGFAVVSMGGRCAIKHFSFNANNGLDFSFKCHRHTVDVKQTLNTYDKPGQIKDTPEVMNGEFIFYDTLYREDNSSEMAERWLMEHGCFDQEKQTQLVKKYNITHTSYDTTHKQIWEVYSVNTIKFNCKYNFVTTGGDDGQINIWDIHRRSRLKKFKQIKHEDILMPITCIEFDRNEDIMGYGVGYNWYKGHKYWVDKIKNVCKAQIRLHRIEMS